MKKRAAQNKASYEGRSHLRGGPVPALDVSSHPEDSSTNSRAAIESKTVLPEIFRRLEGAYGPQHWWPARTKTEIVVGAILTQNTAWTQVERAIANLRTAGALNWSRLRDLPQSELEEMIHPAGTFRVKARRLRALVTYLFDHHAGSLASLLSGELDEVWWRLLSIHGVGRETADAILLYVGGRASFVVDAYTKRILRRHLLIDAKADYESVRAMFHAAVPADARVYNEFHALLVTVAKRHCRTRANCEGCPLADLPHENDED